VLQAGDEMAQQRAVAAVGLGEQIAAMEVDQALVQVHRAGRLAADRLGNEDRLHAVLQGELARCELEQKGLIGQVQRLAMHQIDLELADADLVDPAVGLHTQREQSLLEGVPEWRLLVQLIEAEGLLAALGLAAASARRHQGQFRVGVDGGQIERDLGRHDGLPAARRIALKHPLEH